MAVDDAGRRRQQRSFALQRRLEIARLGAAQQAQAFHPIGRGTLLDRAQPLDLLRRGRDDELAAAPVADPVRLAVRIEQAAAPDAQLRLQRPGCVVEAGVDDFAVARADAAADACLGFEHEGLVAVQSKLARNGKADHAGTHDHGIDAVQGGRGPFRRALIQR